MFSVCVHTIKRDPSSRGWTHPPKNACPSAFVTKYLYTCPHPLALFATSPRMQSEYIFTAHIYIPLTKTVEIMKRQNLQTALCGASWPCSLVFKTSEDKNTGQKKGRMENKRDSGETGSGMT